MFSLDVMNHTGIWTRGFTYGATLILTPLLLWLLARVFPPRNISAAGLSARHAATEGWSVICGIVAVWAALALMLVSRVHNSPWLVGVLLGWLVLAPILFIALRTLPRGLSEWQAFWRFHESRHGISIRVLAAAYAFLSLLGLASTFMIASHQ